MDFAIPVVFPDYVITAPIPAGAAALPDVLPGGDLLPNAARAPATLQQAPEVGHAGVVLVEGSAGTTRYYEYGRYHGSALGHVRRVPVPNMRMIKGQPTLVSLAATLHDVAVKAGRGTRIRAAFLEVDAGYAPMLWYCQTRVQENSNPHRVPYDALNHSCVHFIRAVMEAGGAILPPITDPRPAAYVGELRQLFHEVDYDPVRHALGTRALALP